MFSRNYYKVQRHALARNLKDIRGIKNMSLDELHQKSGVGLLRIIYIEKGRGHVNFEVLCRLAFALKGGCKPPVRTGPGASISAWQQNLKR